MCERAGRRHARARRARQCGSARPRQARAPLARRDVAQLIDELPVLAVVGTQVEGGLEIRDAAELRVKESDRIRATVENLRAMGAEVEEFEDGLRVHGPPPARRAARRARRPPHRDGLRRRRARRRRRDRDRGRRRVRRRLLPRVLPAARIGDGELSLNTTPRIVITGFMGAGKTTVAPRSRACSAALHRPRRPHHRARGAHAAAAHRRRRRGRLPRGGDARARRGARASEAARVIALGGGAWTLERNRLLVREHGCLAVWLDAPFELCWQRIGEDRGEVRPIARDPSRARTLYDARRHAYALAALRVSVTPERSADDIAAEMLAARAREAGSPPTPPTVSTKRLRAARRREYIRSEGRQRVDHGRQEHGRERLEVREGTQERAQLEAPRALERPGLLRATDRRHGRRARAPLPHAAALERRRGHSLPPDRQRHALPRRADGRHHARHALRLRRPRRLRAHHRRASGRGRDGAGRLRYRLRDDVARARTWRRRRRRRRSVWSSTAR